MKTAFREYHLGDTVDANGRKQLVKGDRVNVSRFDVEAFVSEDPNYPPMTRLIFWLTSGKKYDILLAGTPTGISSPEEKSGTTDDKTVRNETE